MRLEILDILPLSGTCRLEFIYLYLKRMMLIFAFVSSFISSRNKNHPFNKIPFYNKHTEDL